MIRFLQRCHEFASLLAEGGRYLMIIFMGIFFPWSQRESLIIMLHKYHESRGLKLEMYHLPGLLQVLLVILLSMREGTV